MILTAQYSDVARETARETARDTSTISGYAAVNAAGGRGDAAGDDGAVGRSELEGRWRNLSKTRHGSEVTDTHL